MERFSLGVFILVLVDFLRSLDGRVPKNELGVARLYTKPLEQCGLRVSKIVEADTA